MTRNQRARLRKVAPAPFLVSHVILRAHVCAVVAASLVPAAGTGAVVTGACSNRLLTRQVSNIDTVDIASGHRSHDGTSGTSLFLRAYRTSTLKGCL